MEIYLVITSAEDELGVGVEVEDALHDLALVHRERAHLEVLLAHEHLDRPLAREVVLEQVLALVALEEAARTSAHAAILHNHRGSPPLRVR